MLPRIHLASRSPRRRELLHQIGVSFDTLSFRSPPRDDPECSELALPGEAPLDYVQRVARAKAVHGVMQDITERKQAEDQIRQLANYDSLTGLPNRRFFRDQFQAALERAKATGSATRSRVYSNRYSWPDTERNVAEAGAPSEAVKVPNCGSGCTAMPMVSSSKPSWSAALNVTL